MMTSAAPKPTSGGGSLPLVLRGPHHRRGGGRSILLPGKGGRGCSGTAGIERICPGIQGVWNLYGSMYGQVWMGCYARFHSLFFTPPGGRHRHDGSRRCLHRRIPLQVSAGRSVGVLLIWNCGGSCWEEIRVPVRRELIDIQTMGVDGWFPYPVGWWLNQRKL